MSTKKNPIEAAKALLKREGYTVTKRRPDPKIGDIVRMPEGEGVILITFNETDSRDEGMGYFKYGGVQVAEDKRNNLYTDPLWIEQNDWQKDDGQYEVVGHINLSKAIVK